MGLAFFMAAARRRAAERQIKAAQLASAAAEADEKRYAESQHKPDALEVKQDEPKCKPGRKKNG